jgi:hypothetical protein
MKITAKEGAFIQDAKKINLTWMGDWDLSYDEVDKFKMTVRVKLGYRLAVLPIIMVVCFFVCIWSQGLKEFPSCVYEIFNNDTLVIRESEERSARYKRMSQVFEKNT